MSDATIVVESADKGGALIQPALPEVIIGIVSPFPDG